METAEKFWWVGTICCIFLGVGVIIGQEIDKQAICDEWTLHGNESFDGYETQVIESPHNYCNGMNVVRKYKFQASDISTIKFSFSPKSNIQYNEDFLVLIYTKIGDDSQSLTFTGTDLSDFSMESNEFTLQFTSDGYTNEYGYKLYATPVKTDSNLADLEPQAATNRVLKFYQLWKQHLSRSL
eukprot:CAMPEP_0115040712 /NCGR_PEP_ID=MMETSP0216-20121206/44989_1 /TAXON_ID=223996 /ORGANISM="Protocruzia adherens, Strain Boccale" /LENGTH=182 /DNA_ID=CAMNT_0002421999 /DNA_START=62 /DNA_END=610 /DNA_ORIENTATION=-